MTQHNHSENVDGLMSRGKAAEAIFMANLENDIETKFPSRIPAAEKASMMALARYAYAAGVTDAIGTIIEIGTENDPA